MTADAAQQAMVVAPFAVLGAYAFGRIWRGTPPPATPAAPSFRIGDVIFASLLVLYFLLGIAFPTDAQPEINTQLLAANAALLLALSGWILGFLAARRLNPTAIFGLAPGRFGRKALWSAGLLVASLPCIQLVDSLVKSAVADGDKNQQVVEFFLKEASDADRFLVALTALVIAPFAEELIFRGYLFGIVRQFGGRLAAIAVSSLLFAAIHLHLPSLPGLFLLAVVLSLVYEKTGTLWAPVAMHALFNAVSIVQLALWPELAQ